MPRGGKREKAGRKTTWQSGVKFEETSPLRVPNYIKDKILGIAHRLDAGEDIDFVSNSKLLDLEQHVSLLLSEKEKLIEQIEKSKVELETKSKEFQLTINELQQKICFSQEHLSIDLVVMNNQIDNLYLLVSQFLYEWLRQIPWLFSLKTIINSHELLSLQEKINGNENLSFVVTSSPEKLSIITNNETVTESEIALNEIVTKTEDYTQMDLLDIKLDEIDKKSMSLKPLNSAELSKRFGKGRSYVRQLKFSKKNCLEELPEILRQHDPENIAWKFSDVDEKYHPII